MAKGWYVVHTYSGYENKVQKHVRMLVDKGGLKDRIFDVKVPAEEVVEVKDGKKRVTSKKFLPGYILVEMDLPDQGWKEIVHGDPRDHRGDGIRRVQPQPEARRHQPGRGAERSSRRPARSRPTGS